MSLPALDPGLRVRARSRGDRTDQGILKKTWNLHSLEKNGTLIYLEHSFSYSLELISIFIWVYSQNFSSFSHLVQKL